MPISGVERDIALLDRLLATPAVQPGECLNCNAYGASVEDLHYDPVTLAAPASPLREPLQVHRTRGRTDALAGRLRT